MFLEKFGGGGLDEHPPRPCKSDVLAENTVQGERIDRLSGTPGGRRTKSPPSAKPSLQPVRLFRCDLTRAVATQTYVCGCCGGFESLREAPPQQPNSRRNSFCHRVRRLRSLITPSSGPLITPPKYIDYTAPKSITNVVVGGIVARPPEPHQDPNKTPRPQEDTKTPASPKTPARHQDSSKTPTPPARPKNLARKRVLTRSVRQVGSET